MVVRPLESFLRIEASSGILLLVIAVLALLWANSPFAHSYHALWHTPVNIGFGELTFSSDLHFVINDGLMVIFFFVVGLEIRREMHRGELSELRRAALPVAAACGGMVLPALIYLALNQSAATRHGWGVPMATDIAFAVGVLMLLGRRVPAALRVLLLALAIIDDIGAILVIAVFYSEGVSLVGLAVALSGVMGVVALQAFGVRAAVVYVLPALVVWSGLLSAGVHPTIAGVILGLLTPARPWFGEHGFLEEAAAAIREFADHTRQQSADYHDLVEPLQRLKIARREAIPPVVRLEVALHPWVAYGIMPLFALANAGVTIDDIDLNAAGSIGIAAGVALGLMIGKPLGIVGTCLIAARFGLCVLPRDVDVRGLWVVGAVAGIGFTMALFIANLAFGAGEPEKLGIAKAAVLIGSLLSGVAALVLGRLLLKKDSGRQITETDAERSTEF
jgi:NhaA family Na+:H+ antiporter